MRAVIVVMLLMVVVSGCANYTTPGRGADLRAISGQTDSAVADALRKKPMANFPANIAVARIQSSEYNSHSASSYGHGRFSIITTRDIEKPQEFERIEKLSQVAGVAPLSRLLLPTELNSDLDLRQAAGQLHCDMLLIYTVDTTFYVRDMATPLTVFSLGLSPNQQARVSSTASAILIDTRNGYVYSTAEASDQRNQVASAWTSRDAVDQSRLTTESKAFEKLVGEIEKSWPAVVAQYAKPPASAQLAR